jgi:hypothetical protein
MKQIIFILSIIVVSVTMKAQEAHISQVYAKPGDTITVSVTGVHFQYIAALGMYLDWDKNALEYLYAENYYPSFYNEKIDTMRVLNTNHDDSTFMIGWYDINGNNVSVEDIFTIFELHFIYKGGSTNLEFDTSQTGFYKQQKKGQIKIPVTYFDGFVKNINELGIYDIRKESFNVYPNPVKDILNINSYVSSPIKNIRIFSTLGEEIYKKQFNKADKIKLNVSTIPAGVYLLNIESNESTYFNKLLKY